MLFWYTATLPPFADSVGTCSILKFSDWIFVVVSWVFLSLVSDMPIIWKSFFDFDMSLFNSWKWNDNELIFKWNKEKGLPMSLKVEFRSLIVKYLVMLFSELIALMKFSVLEIADFDIWVNLNCFPMPLCLNSLRLSTGEMF